MEAIERYCFLRLSTATTPRLQQLLEQVPVNQHRFLPTSTCTGNVLDQATDNLRSAPRVADRLKSASLLFAAVCEVSLL